MTSIANWSYTQPATVWHRQEPDEDDPMAVEGGFSAPVAIMCDYGFNGKVMTDQSGNEIVAKDTYWTEYTGIKEHDYIVLGISTELNPLDAGAQEVLNVVNFGNVFGRMEPPDFAIITG